MLTDPPPPPAPGSPETGLESFVIRFVFAPATQPSAAWHGVVRHVQTNTELHFTRWAEAVQFMARYVPPLAASPPETAPDL